MVYLRKMPFYLVVCCVVSGNKETTKCRMRKLMLKLMFHDWQDARKICNTSCPQPSQEGNVKWTKQAEGRFKCNIDISFS